MIASEKSHQNLLDYNQFLFKRRFEVFFLFFEEKKRIFSSEKMRNLSHCIYGYAQSFSEKIVNLSHYIFVADLLKRNEGVIEITVNNLMYSLIS